MDVRNAKLEKQREILRRKQKQKHAHQASSITAGVRASLMNRGDSGNSLVNRKHRKRECSTDTYAYDGPQSSDLTNSDELNCLHSIDVIRVNYSQKEESNRGEKQSERQNVETLSNTKTTSERPDIKHSFSIQSPSDSDGPGFTRSSTLLSSLDQELCPIASENNTDSQICNDETQIPVDEITSQLTIESPNMSPESNPHKYSHNNVTQHKHTKSRDLENLSRNKQNDKEREMLGFSTGDYITINDNATPFSKDIESVENSTDKVPKVNITIDAENKAAGDRSWFSASSHESQITRPDETSSRPSHYQKNTRKHRKKKIGRTFDSEETVGLEEQENGKELVTDTRRHASAVRVDLSHSLRSGDAPERRNKGFGLKPDTSPLPTVGKRIVWKECEEETVKILRETSSQPSPTPMETLDIHPISMATCEADSQIVRDIALHQVDETEKRLCKFYTTQLVADTKKKMAKERDEARVHRPRAHSRLQRAGIQGRRKSSAFTNTDTRPNSTPGVHRLSNKAGGQQVTDVLGKQSENSFTIRCRITRDKHGVDRGFYPTYYLHMERDEGKRFLLAARLRKRSTTSNYIISCDATNLSRNGGNFAGKLRSNFLGTQFVLYANGQHCSPRVTSSGRQSISQQSVGSLHSAGAMTLEPTNDDIRSNLGQSGRGRELAAVVYSGENMIDSWKRNTTAQLLELQNKSPIWNEETQSYVLNFYGRVTQASVKNFQIVHPSDEDYIIMQFGRVADDTFTMDYAYPMCALQAFGVALSSFDSKLACE